MAEPGNRIASSPSHSAFKSSGVTKYIDDDDDDDHVKVEIVETIRPVTKPNCDKPNTSRDGTVSPANKFPPVVPTNKRKPKPTDAQPLSVQTANAAKPVTPDPGGCRVTNKPPLPPKPQNLSKMKKKIEQFNEQTVGKLAAQTDQLRLEIAELKAALTTEKNAVRVLRAQHESENRKAKADIKRLQDLVQNAKKSTVPSSSSVKRVTKDQNGQSDVATVTTSLPLHHIFAPELAKLTNEISALKDANRSLEEKYQVSESLNEIMYSLSVNGKLKLRGFSVYVIGKRTRDVKRNIEKLIHFPVIVSGVFHSKAFNVHQR
jgi:JAKMIP CC3 domain